LPQTTALTTRSRRSSEYARAMLAGLHPADTLNHLPADLGIPIESVPIRKTLARLADLPLEPRASYRVLETDQMKREEAYTDGLTKTIYPSSATFQELRSGSTRRRFTVAHELYQSTWSLTHTPNVIPAQAGTHPKAREILRSLSQAEPIGVGRALASPPSEPCVRFSRTRLSSRRFPHRECLAR
jgi:hypothetical protein